MLELKKNNVCINHVRHYLMNPGDGTMYRFSIEWFPGDDNTTSYVMNDGVLPDQTQYILLTINMAHGVGYGCVYIPSIQAFGEPDPERNNLPDTRLMSAMAMQGFGSVNSYTLCAVLLACKVLVQHLEADNVSAAAEAMLRVPEILHPAY